MFGPPAKERPKSALNAALALLVGGLVPLAFMATAGASVPDFPSGKFLGTYHVAEAVELGSTGQVSSCDTYSAQISPHCGKDVWAILGPSQIALIDAPNSQLKLSTRLQAFAMFGDPFCFLDCRWEPVLSYGDIRFSLFSSSSFVRAFLGDESVYAGDPQLDEELATYDMFVFHKNLERERINATPATDFDALVRLVASQQLEAGFVPDTSTWRVLLPKGSADIDVSGAPEEILLRETYTSSFFNLPLRTDREYVLIRK